MNLMQWRTVVILVFATAFGCGSATGRISGTVLFRGQPLASGSVTLLAADGQRFDTALVADGSFSFEGVPLGRATIAVHSHPRVPAILLGKDRYTAAGAEAARRVMIPERYGSPPDSGLFVEVRRGEQTCRLELASE